jgi:hypothetical protein
MKNSRLTTTYRAMKRQEKRYFDMIRLLMAQDPRGKKTMAVVVARFKKAHARFSEEAKKIMRPRSTD